MGELKIVKKVINNAVNGLQNQSFTFTVVMPEGTTFDPNTITADDGNGNPVTVTQIAGTNSFQLDISVGNVEANSNKEASVMIRDLPAGSYVITESEKNRYEPNFQGTGTAVCTAVIEAAKQTTATCVNTYPVDTGHLKVQKIVVAADGYSAPANQEFTFTVTGKALTRAGYMVSVDEGVEVLYPVTDGKLVLTLKAGQTALIKNLNLDTYQIVETQVDGYVLTSKTGDSGTIAAETIAEAIFTNTYTRRLGTLTINKEVTGTDAKDTFIFHIKGNDEANKHIDMDVAITGPGSVTICDLPLGRYTVTEDTSWSWRYDLSGSDTADDTITSDDLHAVVTFTNTHENNKWLNDTANMPNVFGKKEDE